MDRKETRDIKHIRWRLGRLLENVKDPFVIGQLKEIRDQCDYAIRPDLVAEFPPKEKFCN